MWSYYVFRSNRFQRDDYASKAEYVVHIKGMGVLGVLPPISWNNLENKKQMMASPTHFFIIMFSFLGVFFIF